MNDPFVQVERLRKRYDDLVAVDGISFEIATGEVFGLLGPNGAGKTTTLEIMEGLRHANDGTIRIAGLELPRQLDRLRQRIGVQLQATSLYDQIKVGEALALFGAYYEKSLAPDALLDLVSLRDKRNARVKALSGGQQQRLALALALVNDPELVFLDEPTTGLDPQARQNVWGIIERMKAERRTVILTTHYMEEAEHLADRVAIIDHGRIIATDSPKGLIRGLNLSGRIECTVDGELPQQSLDKLTSEPQVAVADGHLSFKVADTKQAVIGLLQLAEQADVDIENLSVVQANLEDVFLQLTGHHLRE